MPANVLVNKMNICSACDSSNGTNSSKSSERKNMSNYWLMHSGRLFRLLLLFVWFHAVPFGRRLFFFTFFFAFDVCAIFRFQSNASKKPVWIFMHSKRKNWNLIFFVIFQWLRLCARSSLTEFPSVFFWVCEKVRNAQHARNVNFANLLSAPRIVLNARSHQTHKRAHKHTHSERVQGQMKRNVFCDANRESLHTHVRSIRHCMCDIKSATRNIDQKIEN